MASIPRYATTHRKLTMVIDNREGNAARNIIVTIRPLLEYATGRPDALVVEELPVGDILWRDEDGKQFGFIVERKATSDFWSSIIGHSTDGCAELNRFHEQRGRIRATGIPGGNVMYLWEGALDGGKGGHHDPKILNSAFAKVGLRDGFNLVRTSSIHDTATHLVATHLALESVKPDAAEFKEFDYADYLHFDGSKADITSDQMYRLRLTLIRRLAKNQADAIIAAFPTFDDLMISLISAEATPTSDPAGLIANLTAGDRNRRLGPALAENLVDHLSIRPLTAFLTRNGFVPPAAPESDIDPNASRKPAAPFRIAAKLSGTKRRGPRLTSSRPRRHPACIAPATISPSDFLAGAPPLATPAGAAPPAPPDDGVWDSDEEDDIVVSPDHTRALGTPSRPLTQVRAPDVGTRYMWETLV